MNHRILIVEDEAKLREVLCDYFRSRGELPAQAADGAQALGMLEEDEFDAVLLDILMPGLDGLSVCRAVRRTSGVPIVFLTALSAEEDKLLGYELGADDYVTKPFSMSVLYAKVSALIRRSRGNMLAGDVLEDGGVRLVLSAQKAFAAGRELALTPKEFELLLCFIKNKGVVLTREQLLNEVWGYDFYGDSRTVDTHIKMLRNNLGEYRELIKTVWGVGYRYDEA